jgi:Ca-activated chloride channel family protein
MREYFSNPYYLLLLLLLLPALIVYILRHAKSEPLLAYSHLGRFQSRTPGWKKYFRHLPFAFSLLAAVCLILILARPQSAENLKDVSTEGIDIMISMDISSSMLAQDFQPDRLEAAKQVAAEFIAGRQNDRIGLVVFSAESFSQCPLTSDHAVLVNLFNNIESGMLEDGTAIGMGLSTAISRLKDSNAKSKVIILLTDGVNNRGAIDPLTAAEMAKTYGIRVYTIGLGTRGMAPAPIMDQFGNSRMLYVPVEIDEDILRKIAGMTDGMYFRATDKEKLRAIYQEIDKMEKSKVNIKEYSRKEEEFSGYAIAGLAFLVLALLIKQVILRSIP